MMLKDYLFVAIQACLFLLFAWPVGWGGFFRPTIVFLAGICLCLTGGIFCLAALWQLRGSLSPFPTPVPEGRLQTNGVFAVARHPIYGGLLLLFFGRTLWTGECHQLLVTVGLFLLFYFKSCYEEVLLEARYPAYADYRKKVGRFGPFV